MLVHGVITPEELMDQTDKGLLHLYQLTVTTKHVNYCSRLNGRLADEECTHSTFMGLRTCASKERMAGEHLLRLEQDF